MKKASWNTEKSLKMSIILSYNNHYLLFYTIIFCGKFAI